MRFVLPSLTVYCTTFKCKTNYSLSIKPRLYARTIYYIISDTMAKRKITVDTLK